MNDQAFEEWVNFVAEGAATMSQRNFRWVEANGGIDTLVEVARQRGIHLVRLTDKGNDLLAASQEPFQTLC